MCLLANVVSRFHRLHLPAATVAYFQRRPDASFGDFVKQKEGITIDFQAIGIKKRPDPTIEIVLYRIFQESLINIAKHARAEHVSVSLIYSHPKLIFVIKDDGIGFERNKDVARPFGAKRHGIGLICMRERVAVGGAIDICSGKGQGTAIRVELPAARLKAEV